MVAITKVLQVGMSWNIGGTETYLMQQFRHIEKEKLIYDFVNINAHHKMAFEEEIKASGGKVYDICSRHINPIKHYWQWYQLQRKYSKEYKAIVLNANSLEYVFPLFLAKFFNIPMRIIHSHNAGNQHKLGLLRKTLVQANKILLKYSVSHYFACSKVAGMWMFGDKKFKIINNAINVDKFKFNYKVRSKIRRQFSLEEKFVVGHIGRFDYQKNHEFLIRIFNEIQKIRSDSVLILIGTGENIGNIKKLVSTLRIEEKVKFLGVRNDVVDLLQGVDCFLLPSRFEGLPLVGIEAQAAGLPCFFADTITKELGVTDLAHYISLDDAPEKWAEEICKYSDVERVDMGKYIKEAGYDIKEEIRKVEEFYVKG